jgi:hypothetical protein
MMRDLQFLFCKIFRVSHSRDDHSKCVLHNKRNDRQDQKRPIYPIRLARFDTSTR